MDGLMDRQEEEMIIAAQYLGRILDLYIEWCAGWDWRKNDKGGYNKVLMVTPVKPTLKGLMDYIDEGMPYRQDFKIKKTFDKPGPIWDTHDE